MKKVFLLMMGTLAACSNFGKEGAIAYQEYLQQWVGMPEPALYDTWGSPTTVWNVDEQTKVVTYVSSQNTPINGNFDPYNGVGVDENGIPTEGNFGEQLWDDQNSVFYCKTSFTITNGEVASYTFNGDDCVLPEKW